MADHPLLGIKVFEYLGQSRELPNNHKMIDQFKGLVDKLFDICSYQCDVTARKCRGMMRSCPEDMQILSDIDSILAV